MARLAQTADIRVAHRAWTGLGVYLPVLLFFVASVFPQLLSGEDALLGRFQDDAFYYFVIARNILDHGQSAFLLGEPTNGYHPLWMLMLVGWGAVFGLTLVSVKIMELIVVTAGFALFVRLFRPGGVVEAAFWTFGLWYLLRSIVLFGMETSLLFPCFVLFCGSLLSREGWIAAHRPAWLFLSAGLVIGARLDAALIVLPMLLVAPVTWRAKGAILAALALAGGVYVAVNLWMTGAAMPVSGAVKSLGGLQINTKYLTQVARSADLSRIAEANVFIMTWVNGVSALVMGAVLWIRGRNRGLAALLLAYAAGVALYVAKLAFGSSWLVWAWYGYPALVFPLLVAGPLRRVFRRHPAARLVMGGFAALFLWFFLQAAATYRPSPGFVALNRDFVAAQGDLLAGQTIAMGDRAGSFAWFNGGGVYQLEGLVTGPDYLAVLEGGGDLRAHLCDRGARLFIDYGPDLGSYETVEVEVLRSVLTLFKGPLIRLSSAEQVASYADQSVYGRTGIDDFRIHAWRLDCTG